MNSIRTIGRTPSSLPLTADDIVEFHAARLLLLIHLCGSSERIRGLTKLAKLDFFVRYPAFFNKVAAYLGEETEATGENVESPMVRYRYGPWDKRYYQVLAFLEARELVAVEKQGNTYDFILTSLGKEKAKSLSRSGAFLTLVEHMKCVRQLLSRKGGTKLKDIIYEVFDKEVKQRKLGELIK